MDELSNIIVLSDENGNDVQFEFLDLINYQGGEYVVLLPVEDDGEEVVILKFEEDPNDPESETYAAVDDEDVLEAVFEIFKEKFKDEFDFA